MLVTMRFKSYILFECLLVFLFSYIVFSTFIFPTYYLPTHDGLFHFKMAELILNEGPWVDIRWLPLTVLGEHGTDHQWLWHVLITPFTLISSPEWGLKIAIVFMGALVPAVLCYIARTLRIPYAPAWAISAVVAGSMMPDRILMLRTQNLGIIFISLSILFLHRQHYKKLILVSFAFIQSYHAAVILFPIAILSIFVDIANKKKISIFNFACVFFGISMGLILSPWFPENIDYLLFHTIFKTLNPIEASVGVEWASKHIRTSLLAVWPTLLIIPLLFISVWYRTLKSDTMLWLCCTGLLFAFYLFSFRFGEYFVPIAIISLGMIVRDFVWVNSKPNRLMIMFSHIVVCVLMLLPAGERIAAHKMGNIEKYKEVAKYLELHAKPGELIYNFFWSDFVNLHWQTRSFNYVSGLDDNYLLYQNPRLHKFYNELYNVSLLPDGYTIRAAQLICSVFNSRWVIIAQSYDADSNRLREILEQSKDAEKVLHNQWGALFQINLPQCQPPAATTLGNSR
ncbi:MAG: hypothetical protein V3U88_02745 [Methylococcales bacterium]